ncbi:MAG TPA: molybdate ABC transporter substrate-binding protein [Fibrobacteria bacterium]|jgi:molybdate transport system substrate-binding protein|nr:molybdate ABC transporter substrate-binding protein [Fibrobacteria bacterium]
MLRRIQRSTFLSLLLLAALAAGASAQITVATAASVQFAMQDLIAAFTKKTGYEAKAVYGASGALVTQIRNGAPFDVFVSADASFPDSLKAAGQSAGKSEVYGYGALVLWTTKDLDLSKGLSILANPAVAKIALADVKRAPYGRESAKALKKAGIYDSVEAKLVYGENISQVTQYVVTGNADAGFNAKSIVVAPEMKGRGKWIELDPSLYDRIKQKMVMTRAGYREHPTQSAAFMEFVLSAPGRKILAEYGYSLP